MTYDLGIIKRQRYLPLAPSGGTIVDYVQSNTNYTAHVFYASDQLVLPASITTFDYLIVAGGGGGGSSNYGDPGGGGGAGGVITQTGFTNTSSYYTITVGSGAVGGAIQVPGAQGSNSVISGTGFSTITATGGGGGGAGYYGGAAGTGGSGGGGTNSNLSGGAGIAGQGRNGGAGPAGGNGVSAGGGGAGAVGGAATLNVSGGNGGIGISNGLISTATLISLGIGQYVTATNAVYLAGGGGGGAYKASNPSNVPGQGGAGGGGAGAAVATVCTPVVGQAGKPNTGGGGGGSISAGINANNSNGGSGIVIVRYPSSNAYSTYRSQQPDPYFNQTVLLLSNQSLAPTLIAPTAVDYLLVAGGGAGSAAAGGGAGGLLTATGYAITTGSTYTVTIGAGGATAAATGNNSVFGPLTAWGGGGGTLGVANGGGTGNGGSGGGLSYYGTAGGVGVYPGSTYISAARQGYNGGSGTNASGGTYGGGGGGGAGGAGGTKATANGGDGGVGTSTNIISTTTAASLGVGQVVGNTVYFAGGGAGAGGSTSGVGGLGGGASASPTVANSGVAFTGGGGAGGNSGGPGLGGSGVAIVRYPNSYINASTTGNPVYSNTGGYITYVFTASGTISFPSTVIVNNNNTFIDSSANALTVTPVGTPTQGTVSPFGQQWSTAFNGGADYFTVNPVNTSTFTFGTNNFTIEMWVNPSILRTSSLIDFRPVGVNSLNYMDIWFNASGQVQARVNSANKISSSISGPLLTVNAWHHLAVVKSNGILTMFIDGTSVGSTGDTNSYSVGAGRPVIGAASSTALGLTPFNGYISNLRILNGTALYTNNFTVPTSPLAVIPNTVLLTNASPYPFQDISGLSTTATTGPSSILAPTKFNPFKRGYAYNASLTGGSAYFNGTTDYLTTPYNISTVQWWDTDYTIEMWINASTYSQATLNLNPLQVVYGDPSSTTTYWAFGTNAAGQLYFYYWNGSVIRNAISTAVVSLNSWNHLAMVYINSTSTLNGYINGVQVFSVAKSGTPQGPSGYTLNIGSSEAVRYRGYISNVRIVRGTAVYTTNFTPSSMPLTPIDATTSTSLLLNFTNAAIFDATGINEVLTVNTASLSSNVINYNNRSMSFNGVGDYLRIPAASISTLTTSTFLLGVGDFTMEAWVYPTSTQTSTLIDFRPVGTNGTYPTIGLITGTVVFSVSNAVQITGKTLTPNSWSHIALCRYVNSSTMYINGSPVGTTYIDNNKYSYGFTVTVAAQSFSLGSTPFAGYIDDLRITTGVARYIGGFQAPQFKPPLK